MFQLKDLTGWYWAEPEGQYYIRQVGNQIYWFGENHFDPPIWSNVAYGTINGNIVDVNWVDVPKGLTMGSGTVTLIVNWQMEGNLTPRLTVQQQTGGFGTIAMHGPWRGGTPLKAPVAVPH